MEARMKIYFVRHGESQWNVENRLQGSDDSSLTEKGIRDSQKLRKYLEDSAIVFDQLYSSDSKRCLDTAKIINGRNKLEIKKEKALKEMNVGSWQGMTWEEIKKNEPIAYDYYWHQPDLYKARNGGEDFYAVEKRAVAFIKQLSQRKENQNILIVSHGVLIKSIVNFYKNRSVSEFWEEALIDGSSLTLLERKKEGFISRFTGRKIYLN